MQTDSLTARFWGLVSACIGICFNPGDITSDSPDDVEANLPCWECGKQHGLLGNYAQECMDYCRQVIYNLRCG